MKKIIAVLFVLITSLVALNVEGYQEAELVEIEFDGVLGFDGANAHAVYKTAEGNTIVVLHGGEGKHAGTVVENNVSEWAHTESALYLSCHSATHKLSGSIKPYYETTGLVWHAPVPGGFIYGELPSSVQAIYVAWQKGEVGDMVAMAQYHAVNTLKPIVGYKMAKSIVFFNF